MARKRPTPIHLSRHAVKRWRERVGDDKKIAIQTKIRKGIRSALKKGVLVNGRGATVVNVVPGVRAVVKPDVRGGWQVITVMVYDYERKDAWDDRDVVQVSELPETSPSDMGNGAGMHKAL